MSVQYNPTQLRQSWEHVCVVVDGQMVDIFLNGDNKATGELEVAEEDATATVDGILILAQDQDKHGGGFDPKQSFSGMISDYNIFSRCKQFLAH